MPIKAPVQPSTDERVARLERCVRALVITINRVVPVKDLNGEAGLAELIADVEEALR